MGIQSIFVAAVVFLLLPMAFAQNQHNEYYTKVEVTQVLNGVTIISTSQETKAPTHCLLHNATESTALSSFEKFKAQVVEGKFAPRAGARENYIYAKCSPGETSSLFAGLIRVSTSSICSNKFQRSAFGTELVHAYGSSDAEVKAELRKIIEANPGGPNDYSQISETSFRFVSGHHVYTFNTSYPASANPIEETDLKTGESYRLSEIQSSGL